MKNFIRDNIFVVLIPLVCLFFPFILYDVTGYQGGLAVVCTMMGGMSLFLTTLSKNRKIHVLMGVVVLIIGIVAGQDILNTESTVVEYTEDYRIEETKEFLIFRSTGYLVCGIRRDTTLKYDTDNPLVIYEVSKMDRFGTTTWPNLVAKSNLMSESVNVSRLDRILEQEIYTKEFESEW